MALADVVRVPRGGRDGDGFTGLEIIKFAAKADAQQTGQRDQPARSAPPVWHGTCPSRRLPGAGGRGGLKIVGQAVEIYDLQKCVHLPTWPEAHVGASSIP